MPPAHRYWNSTNASSANPAPDRALNEAAESERRARYQQYADASAQYDGNHRKHLKIREGLVDPNVVINLDGQAIDRIIAFAVPTMPKIELSEVIDTAAEQWLQDCWEHNGGATLLQDLMLYGCLTGHCYARLLEPAAGELPQIVALNPANVISYWRADDLREVLWHELSYTTDRRYKQDFVNLSAFGGSGWQVRTYLLDANQWKLIASQDWRYDLSPIVSWQHLRDPRRFYGRSHLLASRLNDSVNKVASDIKQILRFHASPRTIGKGVSASEITATSIDGFMTIPQDADVFNLEMNSDLASSMGYLDTLSEAHAKEMRIVTLRGGLDAFKGITNLGLQVAFIDMLAQNEQLRRNYGVGIHEITRRLLMLTKQPHNVQPRLKWSLPLPLSALEQTQTVQLQQQLGLLSRQSAAAALNLDWQLEQERLQTEALTPQPPLPQAARGGVKTLDSLLPLAGEGQGVRVKEKLLNARSKLDHYFAHRANRSQSRRSQRADRGAAPDRRERTQRTDRRRATRQRDQPAGRA